MDYLLYPEESNQITVDGISYGSKEYSNRVVDGIINQVSNITDNCQYTHCLGELEVTSDCHVNSIHSGWADNMFMFGPIVTSLIVPSEHSNQQDALNKAADLISTKGINQYYSESWVALSSMTFDSELMSAVKYTRYKKLSKYSPIWLASKN